MTYKLILTGIAFMLYMLPPAQATDIFSTSETYDEALTKAKASNILLMAYVSSEWCTKCKLMENTTFKKPEFQTLLVENFYALKVNIIDVKGKKWREEFDITSVPTLLFFDEKGELIKRTEYLLNYEELKSEMLAVLEFNRTGEWPIERTTHQELSIPDSYDTNLAYTPKSDLEPSPTPSTPPESSPAPPTFYQLNIDTFPIDENSDSVEQMLDKIKLLSAAHQINIKQQDSKFIIYIKKIEGYQRAVNLENKFKTEGFPNAYLLSL